MKQDGTIYTRQLSEAEVQSVISGLPSLIRVLVGDCIVVAEYGWTCNIHNDLQYKPMEVGIGWLDRFLAESMDQRIFVPAHSDLSITTPNGGRQIQFCHESDIHLSGQDTSLVRQASEHELLKGLMKIEMRTTP
jgi:hypothetical protein